MDEIYQLLIAVTQAELNALKPQWQQLLSELKEGAYCLDWRWYESMDRHLLGNTIHFYCLFHRDNLIAIFPLVLQSQSLGILRWTGLRTPFHPHASLYDVLIHPAYLDRDLLPVLVKLAEREHNRRIHFCRFTNVKQRSNLVSLFNNKSLDTTVHVSVSDQCGYIPCASEAEVRQLSSRFLNNVNRHQRRAEERYGFAEFSCIIGTDITDKDINDFLTIEASGWKGEQGVKSAIKLQHELVDFYRAVIKEYAPTGDVCINFMALNRQRCAAQLALKYARTWYLLKICYSPLGQPFGVGNILMKWFIEKSAREGSVSEINFTTAPEWSKRMHIQYENVYTLTFFSNYILCNLVKIVTRTKNKLLKLKPRQTLTSSPN